MTFKQFRTIVDMDKDFTVFFVDEKKACCYGDIAPELYDSYKVDGFISNFVNIINKTEYPSLRDVMINYHVPSDSFRLVLSNGKSIGLTFAEYLERMSIYSDLPVKKIEDNSIYIA